MTWELYPPSPPPPISITAWSCRLTNISGAQYNFPTFSLVNDSAFYAMVK
jgi:hypothetical protein